MDGGWEVYPSFCEILVVGFLSRLRRANFSKGAEGYSWQSQIRRESMGTHPVLHPHPAFPAETRFGSAFFCSP